MEKVEISPVAGTIKIYSIQFQIQPSMALDVYQNLAGLSGWELVYEGPCDVCRGCMFKMRAPASSPAQFEVSVCIECGWGKIIDATGKPFPVDDPGFRELAYIIGVSWACIAQEALAAFVKAWEEKIKKLKKLT